MRKILSVIFLISAISSYVFSQNMSIIRSDGGISQFGIADIDSVTFALTAPDGDKNKMKIYMQSEMLQLLAGDISDIYYSEEGTNISFVTGRGTDKFSLSEIDSIIFDTYLDTTVYISYESGSVSVINPLKLLGVSVETSGADVTVRSEAGIGNINYVLSGTTGDGSFKTYSDLRLELHLNNVQITNPDGPAVNIQTGKKITVILEDGTHNILSDGTVYAAAPDGEDQDAAFFSEGQLFFEGTGDLEINGSGENEHGLKSDDYIDISQGNITVNSAVKDAVNTNDGFFLSGGTVSLTSDGDGIDAGTGAVEISGGNLTVLNEKDNKDAVKTDSTVVITGGDIGITVNGDQSKGINAGQKITVSNGTVNIITSGGASFEVSGSGYDVSYCTALDATDVLVESGSITITTTGIAGKGISCDGTFSMNSGYLNITSGGGGGTYTNEDGELDAYRGTCIIADGNIDINGGEIVLSNSGSGGRGISTDADIGIGTTGDPVISVTTTGTAINLGGGDYAEAKAVKADGMITVDNGTIKVSSADDGIKTKSQTIINGGTVNIVNSVEGLEGPAVTINGGEVRVNASDDGINTTYGVDGEANDGSMLTINGGYVFVSTTRGDGLDSNGNLTINGGTVVVHGPPSEPEVAVDVNGSFKVNGGLIVMSAMNSNMTEGPISSSTQKSVLFRSYTTTRAGTLFHIQDASGNDLLTFAPGRDYSSILFSSSDLSIGTSYSVYTGGSCTGTVTDGLYTGGTYSGGTLKTTFNMNTTAQTVWY